MTAIYKGKPSSMRALFSGVKNYPLAVTDEFSFSFLFKRLSRYFNQRPPFRAGSVFYFLRICDQ